MHNDDDINDEIISATSIPSIRGLREESKHFVRTKRHFLELYWKYVFALAWPLLCAFIFFAGNDRGIRCLFVALVMFGYFLFESLPEGAITLIPIFALPFLTVQTGHTTCSVYFQYGFFVMNAIFISVGLEYSGLHERVILYLLWKSGGSPRAIHLIISTMTMILSVRIANAYTVVLVTPLIEKILFELDTQKVEQSHISIRYSSVNFKRSLKKQTPIHLNMAFFFGIINASTLGGINFVSGKNFTITNKFFLYSCPLLYVGLPKFSPFRTVLSL